MEIEVLLRDLEVPSNPGNSVTNYHAVNMLCSVPPEELQHHGMPLEFMLSLLENYILPGRCSIIA